MNLGAGRMMLTPEVAGAEANSAGASEDIFESYYEYDEEQLSMGGKRQRGDNWTYEDKELLVECVAGYPVVEDRCNEKEINMKKHSSWKLIAEEMALRGSQKNSSFRTPQKVREQWVRLKGKAKAVLKRRRGSASVEEGNTSGGAYKKGPTPIDYRIREIFPHLFGAKVEEFDKHSCDSGHFHGSSSSMNGDLSVPAGHAMDNIHGNQPAHYGIPNNDNCSQDYNPSASNHALSSSEDNSYSFPASVNDVSQAGTQKLMEHARPYDQLSRHLVKRETAPNKGKRLANKRKIPIKLNAFEHLLLQANLKKINLAIKQSEQLHRVKMNVQKKESYLLDLKIKKAEMDIESGLRKQQETSRDSGEHLNQIQMNSSQSRNNLGQTHNNSGQSHNNSGQSHNISGQVHNQNRGPINPNQMVTAGQIQRVSNGGSMNILDLNEAHNGRIMMQGAPGLHNHHHHNSDS